MTTAPSPLGVSREAFLGAIKRSLGPSSAPASAPPEINESVIRTVAAADLIPLFSLRATAVGLRVHQASRASLPAALTALLKSLSCTSAVSTLAADPALAPLDRAMTTAGITLMDWAAHPGLSGQYESHVGVTGVEYAIAETGSIICSSGPGRTRGGSLVPPLHIAILKASQILADLLDYFSIAPLPPDRQPSSIALITGPSKTADIEGVLITGVHGPREVHILLVADA